MDEHATIGARVRAWRLRRGGLSQRALGELAGVSQAYISGVESGRKALDKKATQVAVARALRISVAQLLGEPGDPTDPNKARVMAHVPAIRAALIEAAARRTRDKPERPLDVLEAEARRATRLGVACYYVELGGLLPGLIHDLCYHGGRSFAEALTATKTLLKHTGFTDLALSAADLCCRAAAESGDVALIARAEFGRLTSFPPETSRLAAELAALTADQLQAELADPQVRRMYGQLHLTAAWAGAIARQRSGLADHVAEAEREAASLGEPDPHDFMQAHFGPTNVGIWRMSIATETCDEDEAVRVDETLDPRRLPVPTRHFDYYKDLGRAMARAGHAERAVLAFAQTERSAPERFRIDPVVRESVTVLLNNARRRAGSAELLGLSRRLGIDPL